MATGQLVGVHQVRPSGDVEIVLRGRLEHAARLIVLPPQWLFGVAQRHLSAAKAGLDHVSDVPVDAWPVQAKTSAALRPLDSLVRLVQSGGDVAAQAGRYRQPGAIHNQSAVLVPVLRKSTQGDLSQSSIFRLTVGGGSALSRLGSTSGTSRASSPVSHSACRATMTAAWSGSSSSSAATSSAVGSLVGARDSASGMQWSDSVCQLAVNE